MQIHFSPDPFEDEFPVHMNPGLSGDPFGIIELGHYLKLNILTDEDADQLIRAAVRVKEMRARIGTVHEYKRPGILNGHCEICGLLEDGCTKRRVIEGAVAERGEDPLAPGTWGGPDRGPCGCGHGFREHSVALSDHHRSSCTTGCGCKRYAPASDGQAVTERPADTGPAYHPPAGNGEPRCTASVSRDGQPIWFCTAQAAHSGDHVACGRVGEVCHTWTEQPHGDGGTVVVEEGDDEPQVRIVEADGVPTDLMPAGTEDSCNAKGDHLNYFGEYLYCWRPDGHEGPHYDRVDKVHWAEPERSHA